MCRGIIGHPGGDTPSRRADAQATPSIARSRAAIIASWASIRLFTARDLDALKQLPMRYSGGAEMTFFV